MPFEVNLGHPPIGYNTRLCRAGETAEVEVCAAYTSFDGMDLIKRLEGIPSVLLARTGAKIPFSQVDHMLAVCRPDGTATVYVNELQKGGKVRSARKIDAGHKVIADDIVGVISLDLGVEVPDDCGVVFVISIGWRKGLFFDFSPIGGEPRDYDLAAALGQLHTTLVFRERLEFEDSDWTTLTEHDWFPFIGLSMATVKAMIDHIRSGSSVDELSETVENEIREKITDWQEAWHSHPAFADHIQVVDRAVERFLEKDYMCAALLLYPRIEGIMRLAYGLGGQKRLSRAIRESPLEPGPVLAEKFGRYLEEVYFRSFDPNELEQRVSRHTVSHGVVSAEALSNKAACLGLLIARQLFFLLQRKDD